MASAEQKTPSNVEYKEDGAQWSLDGRKSPAPFEGGAGVAEADRHIPRLENQLYETEIDPDASRPISATSSSSSSSSGDLGTKVRDHLGEISSQDVSVVDSDSLSASAGTYGGEGENGKSMTRARSANRNSIQHRIRSSNYTRESTGRAEVAEANIQYFCAPNQHSTSDSWKIMIFHMVPFTSVPHFIVLFCLWWAYTRWHWMSLLCYTTMCVLSVFSVPIYSRRFRAMLSDYFYGILATYVPEAQYIVPERQFPEDRAYIFACHPHGRMFYSTQIFCQRHSIWRKNILPKGDLFMTAAGGFFYVPFLRNLFYFVGVIPAGKRDIVAKLRKKDHVTILVGGVKEVLLGTIDDVDTIYLKKRKGFCKIAMRENAGVVPVYFFNENQLFRHNSKKFLKFWEDINRHIKIGVPFMRGRYFILPMPFRKPLLIAVGEPLFAEEEESLDEFHERYVEALEDLFDKYVAYSPDPKHKLVIT